MARRKLRNCGKCDDHDVVLHSEARGRRDDPQRAQARFEQGEGEGLRVPDHRTRELLCKNDIIDILKLRSDV